MNKNTKKILLALTYVFAQYTLNAQVLFKENIIIGNNYFATIDENSTPIDSLSSEDYLLKKITKSNPNLSFKFYRQYEDNSNTIHKKYDVFYNKLAVVGMDFVLHEKLNKIQSLNGTFENIENIDLFPKISENAALQIAVSFFKTKNNLLKDVKVNVEKSDFCIAKNQSVEIQFMN